MKKVDEYYNCYRNQEITFSSKVIQQTGVSQKEILIKCGFEKQNAVIYSLSMKGAKVLLPLDREWIERLRKANMHVTLVFVYTQERRIALHIDCTITEFHRYRESKDDVYFAGLEFRKKAPDDLIMLIGKVIANNKKTERRIYQRISINKNQREKLGIKHTDTYLFVKGKAKHCALNELSLLSAQVFVPGEVADYKGRRGMLMIKSETFKEIGEMIGDIYSCEKVEGMSNFVAVVLVFDQNMIPPSYKMFIGKFLESVAAAEKSGE